MNLWIGKVKYMKGNRYLEVIKIPRVSKTNKYEKEREDFSHAASAHIIALVSMKDKNQQILTYEEKQDLVRWIARGEEIISKINPDIFRRSWIYDVSGKTIRNYEKLLQTTR